MPLLASIALVFLPQVIVWIADVEAAGKDGENYVDNDNYDDAADDNDA